MARPRQTDDVWPCWCQSWCQLPAREDGPRRWRGKELVVLDASLAAAERPIFRRLRWSREVHHRPPQRAYIAAGLLAVQHQRQVSTAVVSRALARSASW